MSRKKSDECMSDAQWREFCKALYERKRLRGAKLRNAEAERRKANEPPPTLLEAIEAHLRAQPRLRRDTLSSPQLPPQDSLGKLAALFADDPVLAKLGEAAALTPEERFRLHGWLVGVPYDALAKLPAHMLEDSFRFEIPTWALAAKYDALREDYFLELLDLRLDKAYADKLIADRKHAAKLSTKTRRAMHPDEVGLPEAAQAHLKKLRTRLATADRTLRSAEQATMPTRVESARSYVDSVETLIREARVSCGLPAVEPEELTG